MVRLLAASFASVLLLCTASPATAAGFEVWLVDQSNSPGVSYGGAIYIYQGDDLMGEDAARAHAEKIDLGLATAQLCMASTGANPVRPHMIFFNSNGSHAVLAFVASGHVVFFDAATRTPVWMCPLYSWCRRRPAGPCRSPDARRRGGHRCEPERQIARAHHHKLLGQHLCP